MCILHIYWTEQVYAAGGVEAVLRSMRAFPGSENVHENACTFLANVTANVTACEAEESSANADSLPNGEVQMSAAGESRRQATISLKGPEAVIKAMLNFDRSEGVQREGCLALGNMAGAPHIGFDGGPEVVLQAMSAFPDSEGVQEKGLAALVFMQPRGLVRPDRNFPLSQSFAHTKMISRCGAGGKSATLGRGFGRQRQRQRQRQSDFSQGCSRGKGRPAQVSGQRRQSA